MGYRGYGSSGGYGSQWAPYISVGQKLAMAKKKAAQLAKKQKREPAPVTVDGRIIAKSFWGKAWCDNLAAYSDFSNRLPRGATYVRNGSVVDLVITQGKIEAMVAGSEPYQISITIEKLAAATWKKIKQNCSSSIDSLFDLLAGRLSDGVMQGLTNRTSGCFPAPREIKMKCSCPDYSNCCKHLAAVMYGVGNRLDSKPELLFLLRGVDHAELVTAAVSKDNLDRALVASGDSTIAQSELSDIFGIELDHSPAPSNPESSATSLKPIRKTKISSRKTKSPEPRSKTRKSEQAPVKKVIVRKSVSNRATKKATGSLSAKLKEDTKTTKAINATKVTPTINPTGSRKSRLHSPSDQLAPSDTKTENRLSKKTVVGKPVAGNRKASRVIPTTTAKKSPIQKKSSVKKSIVKKMAAVKTAKPK